MDIDKLYEFVENKIKNRKILVLGDVMLDKYYYGEVNRISPEAPVPITRVLKEKETLGGAANVAHNLALLGVKVMIAGFIGSDNHGSSLLEKFISAGVDIGGIIATKSPTTTKIRVIGGHQQMLRLDFEDSSPPIKSDADKIKRYITERLNESMDAVIISDYGKGIVTEDIARFTIDEAHNHGVPVIVEPKGVHWGKYKGADFVTPNLKEINDIMVESVPNDDEEVAKAARYIMRKFSVKNVIATRSEKGLTLVTNSVTEHIPTESREVFDVSGAGDTVIAVFSTAIAGGLSPASSARLANLAASVVVAKVGTYAVSREELLNAIKKNMEEI